MRREEWRMAMEAVAAGRRVNIVCCRLDEWQRAVRELLPLCSAQVKEQVAALEATMVTGPCAGCGVTVIWGQATPLEPLKYCEPCATASRRPDDLVIDGPSTFTE